MKTTTAADPATFEVHYATAAPKFSPCPLHDTLSLLFSVAGLGGLVKVVLIILTVVAGH